MPTNEELQQLKDTIDRLNREKNILGLQVEVLTSFAKQFSKDKRENLLNNFIQPYAENKQNYYRNAYAQIKFD